MMGVVATLPLLARLEGANEFWPIYDLNVCKGYVLVEVLRSLCFVAYGEIAQIVDGDGKYYHIEDFMEIT